MPPPVKFTRLFSAKQKKFSCEDKGTVSNPTSWSEDWISLENILCTIITIIIKCFQHTTHFVSLEDIFATTSSWGFNEKIQTSVYYQTKKQTTCSFVVFLPLSWTNSLLFDESLSLGALMCVVVRVIVRRPSPSSSPVSEVEYWSSSCLWKRPRASTVRLSRKVEYPSHSYYCCYL